LRLDVLERGINNLAPEDFQILVRRIAHAITRASWPAIRKLELVLTEDCNLRCDYCWIPKQPAYMPWEVAKRALEFLFIESRDAESVEITLFGGEPLLAWDVFTRAVEYAERLAKQTDKRVGWAVTTNGTLLEEENIRFAVQHGIHYLLSIDGDRPSHDLHRRDDSGKGSFDRVIANIPSLKRLQGWLGTRMTVNPDTVEGVDRAVRLLAHLGINQFLIAPNITADWTREARLVLQQQWVEIARLYAKMRRAGWPIRMTGFEERPEREKPKGWGCEAGQDKIAVTPSGDIYPCSRYLDVDWLREASWLGHVDTGISADGRRRELTDGREVIRFKCMKCRHKDRCTGSCPATNWLTTGSPFAPPRIDCYLHDVSERLKREVPEAWEASKIPFRREPLPLLGDSCAEQASPCGIRPLN
jgi:uncharacterized protein